MGQLKTQLIVKTWKRRFIPCSCIEKTRGPMSSLAPKCFVRVSTWGLSWNKGKHIFKQSRPRCVVPALMHHCLISFSLQGDLTSCQNWKISLSRRQTPLLLVPGLHLFFWPTQNSWENFRFWGPLFQRSSCQGKSTSISLKHLPFFQTVMLSAEIGAYIQSLMVAINHTKLGSVILKHPGSSENSLAIILTLEEGSKYSHGSGKEEGWAQGIKMQLQFGSGAMRTQ